MKKLLSFLLLCPILCLTVSGCAPSLKQEMPEDFAFSLTWGTFGESSYDSKTGKLVKTTNATNPEDYETTCILSHEQMEEIYGLIRKLNPNSYPDEMKSWQFGSSDPYLTLSLTVEIGDRQKTVKADEVASLRTAKTPKAKRYADTVAAIRDILTDTEEWKSLPDYEFLYD